MKISLICFAAMVALLPIGSGFGASSPYTVVKPDPQSVAVATKWLSLMDAGNYAQAYEMYPARIRAAGDLVEKQNIGYWRARRTPLGRTLSRKLAKAYFTRTLQGSPDGYYELLHYNTSFQRKAKAIEGVVITKESGHWQVSGYRIR